MNLRKHPPERRRKGVTLAAHGCCCCCCCCLHSVGGLIGSAIGGVKAHSDEARRTVKVYWLILMALTALTVASVSAENRGNVGIGLLVTAMILPGVQLGASFFTLCAGMFLALDKGALGRITWKGFLWGLVGFLMMAVPLILMSFLS